MKLKLNIGNVCFLLCVCIIFYGSVGFAQGTLRERLRDRWLERKQAAKKGKSGSGDYNFSLQHDGLTRKYLVHVPSTYDKSNPAPLILAFHGGLGNSEHFADDGVFHLISKSNSEGFIIAFPNGVSPLRSGKLATWNAGNCCAYAVQTKSDDVGFVKKIIDDMEKKFSIDRKRIYAAGFSNGGMLCYRLACEMTSTFKAIASVAGTDNYDACNPQMPISIMHIHAKDDDHVLFNGGCGPKCKIKSETDFTSVAETISRWVKRNNCSGIPKRVMEKEGVYCDLYTGCDGNVQIKLCVTETGGHSWPGGKKSREQADTSTNVFSATDIIWDFFSSKF